MNPLDYRNTKLPQDARLQLFTIFVENELKELKSREFVAPKEFHTSNTFLNKRLIDLESRVEEMFNSLDVLQDVMLESQTPKKFSFRNLFK